jgi:excisionase family DNA binding protein
MDSNKFYSVGEFAKLTGRSQTFIRRLCDKGVITCYKPGGLKRYIPESGFEEMKVNSYTPVKREKPKVTRHHGSDLRVIPAYKRA